MPPPPSADVLLTAFYPDLPFTSRRPPEHITVNGQALPELTHRAITVANGSTDTALIAAAVEQQGAATQEIVRNVGQAAAGTSAVTDTITGVAQAADGTGAAASQMLASASALSDRSEHLGREVARFLATVRAA